MMRGAAAEISIIPLGDRICDFETVSQSEINGVSC